MKSKRVSSAFDEMAFASEAVAVVGLSRNGFRRFNDAPDLQSFLNAPETPFCESRRQTGQRNRSDSLAVAE